MIFLGVYHEDCARLGGFRPVNQLVEIEENAADGIISVDAEGRLTHFNAAAEGIFGYARAEVLGQPLYTLLLEADRQRHNAHMHGFAAAGDTARHMAKRSTVVGRHKSGHAIPLDISILRHKEPGVRCFTAILRDVSARVEQQRVVSEQGRKFRAIFDGSSQFVALLDTAGVIIKLNRSAQKFIGAHRRGYAGTALWEADFWPNELERASLRDATALAARGKFVRQLIAIRGDLDKIAKLDLALKCIRAPDGMVEFLIAEGRDVTELSDANEALRRSESRLSHAQKIAHLGNWEWTLATDQLLWSDEVYRIFGLTPDTFGASYDAFLRSVHPDDRALLQAAVDRALQDGAPYSFQHRIICPDGAEKVVHERGEVLCDTDGRPQIMSGTVQDITEAWRREQALAGALQAAEAANRAKSHFLATMSHELRTPLNAIIGFSEFLRADNGGAVSDAARMEYAGYIYDSGKHLLHLINDILNIARLESGATEVERAAFTPADTIVLVFRLLQANADAKGVTLMTGSVADAQLYLDELQLKQILLNLVGNAVKFTAGGGRVCVSFDVERDGPVITVADTGIGIAPEHLERIFEPFFQIEGVYARHHGGVGLGLAITKKLVEAQGGAITVSSAPGRGTVFRLAFPTDSLLPATEGSAPATTPDVRVNLA